MAYAYVDDILYRRWGSLYAGDVLLEHVPRLAICINLGEDLGAMLFHCDSDWNVLGISGAPTIEGAKKRAEENYPGVGSRWNDINTSAEAALEYYDAQTCNLKCSFCGKRPFEVEGWVEGKAAIICHGCIVEYYHELQKTS